MLFAGDIGGTKTNLALFAEDDLNTPLHFETFHSADYPNLQAMVLEYLKKESFSNVIRRGCLAIAGPVINGVCKVTNLPWIVSVAELKSATKIENLHLINDLEANAYSLDLLPKDVLVKIHDGATSQGNRAVLSPGTGLGEAGILYTKGKYLPFPSEGGHCDFGPATDLQIELAHYYYHKLGHFSYDRLLSGPGFMNLYQFFLEAKEMKVEDEIKEEIERYGSAAITKHALEGSSKICEDVLSLYVEILGQEIGNVALKFMAVGGLYLGGGIPPKILPFLKEGSSFLKGYLNKGRFREFLNQIPIHVILDDKASLKGAASYAKQATD